VSDEREPTAAEIQTWRRDNVLLPAGRRTAEEFPRLNVSAGFLFGGVIRPLEPTAPEYVALPMLESSGLEMVGAVGKWNDHWGTTTGALAPSVGVRKGSRYGTTKHVCASSAQTPRVPVGRSACGDRLATRVPCGSILLKVICPHRS